MTTLDQLKDAPSFYYLATVYSKHPMGIAVAHGEACLILTKLLDAGVPTFSPIAHTHHVGAFCTKGQLDHDFWMKADAPLMRAACGIIVVTMPGWMKSRGVQEEISYFQDAGKPVVYLDPKTMEITR